MLLKQCKIFLCLFWFCFLCLYILYIPYKRPVTLAAANYQSRACPRGSSWLFPAPPQPCVPTGPALPCPSGPGRCPRLWNLVHTSAFAASHPTAKPAKSSAPRQVASITSVTQPVSHFADFLAPESTRPDSRHPSRQLP